MRTMHEHTVCSIPPYELAPADISTQDVKLCDWSRIEVPSTHLLTTSTMYVAMRPGSSDNVSSTHDV